jgi:hypothetical protein
VVAANVQHSLEERICSVPEKITEGARPQWRAGNELKPGDGFPLPCV